MGAVDEARARLRVERERVARSLGAARQEFTDDGPITRSGDNAADTTAAQANMELRRELEAELGEIDAALQRIENGTYGIDEKTGEPIDPARLEAVPTARTNI